MATIDRNGFGGRVRAHAPALGDSDGEATLLASREDVGAASAAYLREFGGAELASALAAALEGVVELGAAQEGDKTMVDALAPAVRALDESITRGLTVGDAVKAAFEAGEHGMRATVPLQASKGRASYLGERSIGHQDPGATSTVLILGALASTVAREATAPICNSLRMTRAAG